MKSEAGQLEARLLKAARSVFLERGYAAATMSEIVTRARASKRTVYSRFPSKAALFEVALADHIEEKFADAEAGVNPRQAVREQLVALGRGYMAAALDTESQALDRIVMAEAASFPHLASRLHSMGFQRATAVVARLLRLAGAREPRLGSEAFYALLVLAPMRNLSISTAPHGPDVELVVDFVLAGLGVSPSPSP